MSNSETQTWLTDDIISALAEEARAHGDETLWQTCRDAIEAGSEAALDIIRRVLADAADAADAASK